jgi:hypothetical protein
MKSSPAISIDSMEWISNISEATKDVTLLIDFNVRVGKHLTKDITGTWRKSLKSNR